MKAERLIFLKIGVLVFAAVLSFRLYVLSEKEHNQWIARAAKQHTTGKEIQAARGSIYDRAGRPLVYSVRAVNIAANPRVFKPDGAVLASLAEVAHVTPSEISRRLKSKSSFVYLARGVKPNEIDGVGLEAMKGVHLLSDYRRGFPQGKLASTLLGRVDTDGKGLSGVEQYFDEELTAASTQLALRRDAKGRLVRVSLNQTQADEQETIRNEGDSLQLSIDSRIQSSLELELEKAKQEAKAKHAFGIMLDADSGEILAMAQTQGYDPSKTKRLTPGMLKNRVLQDTFEPGSTLKPLVAALGLEKKLFSKNQQLDCENGKIKVGKHTIRDVHPESILSVRDVLVRSSNVCMVKIGQRLGEHLKSGLKDFGFGKKVELELNGEAKGIFRNKWREIDFATASFGHGLSVSALQLARAYAALANGGKLVKPTLLKGNSTESASVLSSKTASIVSSMLRGVTEDEHGTGKNARVSGLTVYGKTGTAEKIRLNGRGYDSNRVLASFIGYVDTAELGLDKKLVLYIGVDEPDVYPRWGGTLAAPVFSKVMEKTVSYLLRTEPSRIITAKTNVTDRVAS